MSTKKSEEQLRREAERERCERAQEERDAKRRAEEQEAWDKAFGDFGRGAKTHEEWMKDPTYAARVGRRERYIKRWRGDPDNFDVADALLEQTNEHAKDPDGGLLVTRPPPRQWLYGTKLLRQYVTTTIAAGGGAKSILALVEAIAMTTGRKLLRDAPAQPLRVIVYNLEDSMDELERRVLAICLQFDIDPSELQGRLRLLSGRNDTLILATPGDAESKFVMVPDAAYRLEELILNFKADVTVLDPFVSTHQVGESDNVAMDSIMKTLNRIAEFTDSAFYVVHHIRKMAVGEDNEADASRGASAVQNAARASRRLRRMSADEAALARIPEEERERYFYTTSAKSNFTLASKSEWYRLVSVALNNGVPAYPHGDHVGVPVVWDFPSETALKEETHTNLPLVRAVQEVVARGGNYQREPVTSPHFVGPAVYHLFNLDPRAKRARGVKPPSVIVQEAVSQWLTDGYLVEIKGERRSSRHLRAPYLAVGKPAEEASEKAASPEGPAFAPLADDEGE